MSNQKRELQKKKKEQAIRRNNLKKSIRNIVIGVAALLLISCIGYIIYYNTVLITRPVSNYSEGLAEDGTIQNVDVKEYVKLCDYKAMEVAYADLVPAEGAIAAQIDNVLQMHKEYSSEAGQVVKMDDNIRIQYVGKIDGVPFEGGSTPEDGIEIVVGQAGYIDDFEEQLVGKKVGTDFDIEVTFPEGYQNPDVAGKDAVFSISLKGIYQVPAFDDAFVKKYLSDYAVTAEGYRQYLIDTAVEEALEKYVETYILNSCGVEQYPDAYVKQVMGIAKYDDVSSYEYMNEMYLSYFGSAMYRNFKEYVIDTKDVASELEYEAYLKIQAEKAVAERMIWQAIYEDAGLSITSEHISRALEEKGTDLALISEAEESYGKGYIYQLAMKEAVMEYLLGEIKVVK